MVALQDGNVRIDGACERIGAWSGFRTVTGSRIAWQGDGEGVSIGIFAVEIAPVDGCSARFP